jgi:hypothetical protein
MTEQWGFDDAASYSEYVKACRVADDEYKDALNKARIKKDAAITAATAKITDPRMTLRKARS